MAINELNTLLTNPELLGLERQRRMAQALVQQGMQMPQGEMIGNRYVPVNPMQYIGNLFNVYAGQKGLENIDLKEAELAKALREQGAREVNDILTLSQGRPELPSEELAGPAYNGVAPSIQYPAIPADTQAALAKALTSQNPQAQTLVAPLMQNLLPKKTDKLIEYDTYKKEGGKMSFTDWADRIEKERLALDRQRVNLEGARFNLEKQKVENELKFGKPLTGEAAKQVTGATNLKSAVDNYQTMLKDFNTIDFANPNARAKIGEAYNNMMLQAKEAYNLGVLNGPDYKILTSIVKDPTDLSSLLVSKKTLQDQANSLKGYSDTIIKNVYTTHQKPLPENLTSSVAPTQTNTATKGKIPAGVSPELWNVMTPEEKAAFQ